MIINDQVRKIPIRIITHPKADPSLLKGAQFLYGQRWAGIMINIDLYLRVMHGYPYMEPLVGGGRRIDGLFKNTGPFAAQPLPGKIGLVDILYRMRFPHGVGRAKIKRPEIDRFHRILIYPMKGDADKTLLQHILSTNV